jgi:hypothetical protein
MTQDPTSTAEEPLDEHARAAADALMAQRPQPRANFRGALARRLSALDPGFGPRPPDLWWRVLVLVAIGSLLLVLGVVRADGQTALQHPTITRGPGLTLGFSDAPELTAGSEAESAAQWGQKADSVGATIVRVPVFWSAIAPTELPASGFDASDPDSPYYNWASLDQQVKQLTTEGFRVMLYVSVAPTWAEGPNRPSWAAPGTWDPSATDFSEFTQALATRYDGSQPDPEDPGAFLPRVSLWQAWNEPNLDIELSPQWVLVGKHYEPASPLIYRRLLNAFYYSVKQVSSSNYVVAAGTAPYGLPRGPDTGAAQMAPVTFDQSLFCLNTSDRRVDCPYPAEFDAIDHHPYGFAGPLVHAFNATDVAVPDIDKLVRVLDAAERAHTVLPAGKKAIWVTEIAWNTSPPAAEEVPVNEAARWVEQAFYVLWKQGVNTILWYELADEGPGYYDSGVYYQDGKPKPGATAFRFPFVTNRHNKRTIEAWGRAPAAGVLKIEVDRDRKWRVVTEFTAKPAEVFELPLKLKGKLTLRAVLGKYTSLNWAQSA